MTISIIFKKVGYDICIGKQSSRHKQIYWFSIAKVYLDENGEVYFGKQLVAI